MAPRIGRRALLRLGAAATLAGSAPAASGAPAVVEWVEGAADRNRLLQWSQYKNGGPVRPENPVGTPRRPRGERQHEADAVGG
jgi:hypothetical protein